MKGNEFPGGERGDGAIPMGPDFEEWQRASDKAEAALAGMPFVAVPIEQLASIYERFLRLNRIGSRTIEDWLSMPENEKLIRLAVFAQSDFGAVFAGQWLPKEIREQVRKRLERAQ